MRSAALQAEMREAAMAMPRGEIEAIGGPDAYTFYLIGRAKIRLDKIGALYQPDKTGDEALISPIRVEHPATFESTEPCAFLRLGAPVDLLAWHPKHPLRWALRTGSAEVLGLVPPQYEGEGATPIWRSPLSWFRHQMRGLVILDPAAAYGVLSSLRSIVAEDDLHRRQLARLCARPWPVPPISVPDRSRGAGCRMMP